MPHEQKGGLMIAIGIPKRRTPGGDPDTDRPPMMRKPPGGFQESEPQSTGISPQEASFHDQSQTCGNCEYFDMDGNEGVGQCKKGVQVDYATSYPDASWCRYWESKRESVEPGAAPKEEMRGEPAAETA